MCSPITKDAVAPGDGAFSTCIAFSNSIILKSSTKLPWLSTA